MDKKRMQKIMKLRVPWMETFKQFIFYWFTGKSLLHCSAADMGHTDSSRSMIISYRKTASPHDNREYLTDVYRFFITASPPVGDVTFVITGSGTVVIGPFSKALYIPHRDTIQTNADTTAEEMTAIIAAAPSNSKCTPSVALAMFNIFKNKIKEGDWELSENKLVPYTGFLPNKEEV